MAPSNPRPEGAPDVAPPRSAPDAGTPIDTADPSAGAVDPAVGHGDPARVADDPEGLRLVDDGGVPVLVLPDALPFPVLRERVREALPGIAASLGGRAVRLDLGTRDIVLFDVRRILHLLRDSFQVEVTGLYVLPDAIHRYAERELKLKLFPREPAAPAPPADDADDAPSAGLPGADDVLAALAAAVGDETPATGDDAADDATGDADANPVTDTGTGGADADLLPGDEITDEVDLADAPEVFDAPEAEEAPPEAFELRPAVRRAIPLPDLPVDDAVEDEPGVRRTLYVRRTLRSGSAVRHDGDIVVFGDVNAGAQVRAGGNVLVLGRVRGMVHAGYPDDAAALILAFDLAPTQLRLGRHIAITPAKGRGAGAGFAPEIAHVASDGETLLVEPYTGRLPATRA